MPNGYTSKIYDGKPVTKDEFIWDCARAFGAMIELRDEPIGAKVPEAFQPNRFYLNQKEEKEKELIALLSLSVEEIADRIETAYTKEVERIQKILAEKKSLKQRYEIMLNEVHAWIPPTEEHVNLKDFCIKQLEEGIKFDCSIEYYENYPISKLTPEEWRAEEVKRLTEQTERYEKEWKEEQERIAGRNEWVQALRESLKTTQ